MSRNYDVPPNAPIGAQWWMPKLPRHESARLWIGEKMLIILGLGFYASSLKAKRVDRHPPFVRVAGQWERLVDAGGAETISLDGCWRGFSIYPLRAAA